MTIDEAIQYAENLGTEEENKIDYDKDSPHMIICRKNTVKDYRQLAEWLTDYKELKNSIGAVKLSNMKEALALIRTLKAGLNGWREDPFGIIAEVCGAVTDCRRCQWYEKCPYPKNYESCPEDWRTENENNK